jgi:HD-like signal output (HDOD) protein
MGEIAAMDLKQSFMNDLNNDRFVLTSLPEVAMNIRKALEDDDISVNAIAELISRDPAIAAKVMKMANSVFYRGPQACNTVSASVARMGFETTRKLVTSFAVKELFNSASPALAREMQKAWEHSLQVGAIAHAMAKHLGICPPEEALLAGVLSNIGVLSVFNYAANYPEICEDEEILTRTVDELKTEVGALVLDRWAFPADYLACALEAENWSRDTGKPLDLCDLIVLANYHAYIGKRELPKIDQLPAFRKLSSDALAPELAINFLHEAEEEIRAARAVLAA